MKQPKISDTITLRRAVKKGLAGADEIRRMIFSGHLRLFDTPLGENVLEVMPLSTLVMLVGVESRPGELRNHRSDTEEGCKLICEGLARPEQDSWDLSAMMDVILNLRVEPAELESCLGRWREETGTPKACTAAFYRTSLGWRVEFEDARGDCRPLAGLDDLHRLISHPHNVVKARELCGRGDDVPTEGDDQARADVEARLARIIEEQSDIQAKDDAESHASRYDELEAERQDLLVYLSGNFDIHGRPRPAGSADERARVAVRKRIDRALDEIATVSPAMAEHLGDSVSTGIECSYRPRGKPSWVLSPTG